MDIELAREFVVFSQSLNYTSAAKRLFIAQSTLSKHIAKLEAEIGVELVDHSRTPQLTQAGRSFASKAPLLIAQHDAIVGTCREVAEAERQKIRIVDVRDAFDLVNHFKAIRKEGFSLSYVPLGEKSPRTEFDILDDGIVDISFACSSRDSADAFADVDASRYGFIPLDPITIVVGLAIDHPFAEAGELPLRDLSSLTVVFEGDPFWVRGERAVASVLETSGYHFRFSSSKQNSKMELAAQDHSLAITTWKHVVEKVGYLYEDRLAFLPIKDCHMVIYPWAIYRKDNPNPLVSRLADCWRGLSRAAE